MHFRDNLFNICKWPCTVQYSLLATVYVIKVSVPVSEVIGVEAGRVAILPQRSVQDADRDFTGELEEMLSNVTASRLDAIQNQTIQSDSTVSVTHL